MCRVYDGVDQLSQEVGEFAEMLVETAERLLPRVQPKGHSKWKDDILSRLCAQSSAARKAWKLAGTPSEGPLFEEKGRLRRAVRQRVRFCAARAERQRIQRRDRLFAVGDRNRFRAPKGRQNECKLVVNGKIVKDPELLLDEWVSPFSRLAKSRRESLPSLQKLRNGKSCLRPRPWE